MSEFAFVVEKKRGKKVEVMTLHKGTGFSRRETSTSPQAAKDRGVKRIREFLALFARIE